MEVIEVEELARRVALVDKNLWREAASAEVVRPHRMRKGEPRHRDPSTPQWSHRERQVPGVSSSLEAMLAAPSW